MNAADKPDEPTLAAVRALIDKLAMAELVAHEGGPLPTRADLIGMFQMLQLDLMRIAARLAAAERTSQQR